MTRLLASTKKGLFALSGDSAGRFTLESRHFAGEPVDFAMRDGRSGSLLAATSSPFYGPKIWLLQEPDGEWKQAAGVALPEHLGEALERVWVIAPGERDGQLYAGADPGALFVSGDGGSSWSLNRALSEHPSRPGWKPGGGGLCLHSIATWPGRPERLAVAVSAAGIWLTDDEAQTWRQGNHGLVARYLPEERREGATALCVHHIERAPMRPERLFMQFHGGVYRSDDAGRSWLDIGRGLPSDFSFPLCVDPADPDSAFVIPLSADTDRVTPGGKARVYVTRDAGASWSVCPAEGLPESDAYLTVLRQAFVTNGAGAELELYFGTTTGEIFGSRNAGQSWFQAAAMLPPIYALAADG